MKIFLILLMAVTFASCGDKGLSPDQTPVPSALQGGTWINLDSNNTTTELVFNANNTMTMTKTTPPAAPVVINYSLIPYSHKGFQAITYDSNATEGGIIEYQDLQSNSARFCIPVIVSQIVNCRSYTR